MMTRTSWMGLAFLALGTGAWFAGSGVAQQARQGTTENAAPSECALRMQEVSGGEFFTAEDAPYRRHAEVLSDLRDSAMQLQVQGLDEACLKVVDAMQTAIASFQAAAPAAPGMTGALGGLVTRGDIDRAALEQRLVSLDASDMPINTARLEGTDLYNLDGEDIGNVRGLLMAQGKPTHMIVSHGGFWDLGNNDAAIPLDIVRWDPEWQAFFAPLTDERLDEAPGYDENAWDGAANDRFYEALGG